MAQHLYKIRGTLDDSLGDSLGNARSRKAGAPIHFTAWFPARPRRRQR
jgi:hypothetical protein